MKTFHKVLLKVLKFRENDDEMSDEAHESHSQILFDLHVANGF